MFKLQWVLTVCLAVLFSGSALAGDEAKLVGLFLEAREPDVSDKTAVDAAGNTQAQQPFVIGIDDTLVAYLSDAKMLSNKARCLDAEGNKLPGSCVEQNLALFLDGNKVSEAKSDHMEDSDAAAIPGLGKVRFKLEYDQDTNRDSWARLLGSPGFKDFFVKPVTVRIGLADGYIAPMEKGSGLDKDVDHKVQLQRIKKPWFFASLVVLASLFWVFVKAAHNTDLLRDMGESSNPRSKPWSLARCQMAFWFFLITGSFIFIWLITNALDTLTDSVLVLMGLGAGTALGSALIDASRDTGKQREGLLEQAKTLEAQLADINSRLLNKPASNDGDTAASAAVDSNPQSGWAAVAASTEKRLAEVQTQLADLDVPAVSELFWNDLLKDGSSMSFHRFQMVVWTAVLGVVFIYNVWKTLTMPEFDTTLLSLMGISSGTYLGFKLPSANS